MGSQWTVKWESLSKKVIGGSKESFPEPMESQLRPNGESNESLIESKESLLESMESQRIVLFETREDSVFIDQVLTDQA